MSGDRQDHEPVATDLVVVDDPQLVQLFRRWGEQLLATYATRWGMVGHHECHAEHLIATVWVDSTRVAFTRATGFARVTHFHDPPQLDLVVISREGKILYDQRIPAPER